MALSLKEGVVVYPFGKQCEPITWETATPEQVQYLLDTCKISQDEVNEDSSPKKVTTKKEK